MFNMMKTRYGGSESVRLTQKISRILAETSLHAGCDLAEEKGPAPIMNERFLITNELVNKFPHLRESFLIGEYALGKELIVHSEYMRRMPKALTDKIQKIGIRFSHATSIAPTGTMALGIENNVSNG